MIYSFIRGSEDSIVHVTSTGSMTDWACLLTDGVCSVLEV